MTQQVGFRKKLNYIKCVELFGGFVFSVQYVGYIHLLEF